jgi:molybdopterin-guanine dinucleotide biosynthesis protein A
MDIDAYIFIGGRSSRLGQDKALVQLGGTTLAARAAATMLRALTPNGVRFVAADAGQFAHFEDLGDQTTFIQDIYPGHGAVGALHSALASATSQWIAVLACDLPFVTTELVQRLAAGVSDKFDAVIPVQSDGRLQPLCAFYRAAPCLRSLDSVLAGGKKVPPLASLSGQVRTRSVAFHEISDLPGAEHFFLNINAPDDLKMAETIERQLASVDS